MKIQQIACVLLAALLVSSEASAHGDEKHGGATIQGSIQKVSTESIEVETPTGLVTVTLMEKSEIVSEEEKALGRDALTPGVHVMVMGHKLPGGGVAAVEVMVHGNESERRR